MRVLPLWVSLTVLGCAHSDHRGVDDLVDASREASGQSASAQTLALAGFHALLVDGDAGLAQKRFAQSLAKDDKNVAALEGQVWLAWREGSTQNAPQLRVCEAAPRHPLCAEAASRLFERVGRSTAGDGAMKSAFERLLAAGMPGTAAGAMRAALANMALRAGAANAQDLANEAGLVTAYSLVGPFSALHQLGFDAQTSAESTGDFGVFPNGPYGPLTPRPFAVRDGRMDFDGEPHAGDVYLLGADISLESGGRFVLEAASALDFEVRVDGERVASRRTYARPAPLLIRTELSLGRGSHRLLVKLIRQGSGETFSSQLYRVDGKASGVTSVKPAHGMPAQWSVSEPKASDNVSSATALFDSLRGTFGGDLAAVLAAFHAAPRDPSGARALMHGLDARMAGPAVAVLKARLLSEDTSLGAKVGQGRAAKELEDALTKDPSFVPALRAQSEAAAGDGRMLEALERATAARLKTQDASLYLLEARAQLALGDDAAAVASAKRALALDEGHCEALGLSYDVARRRDAASEAAALHEKLARCPQGLSRLEEFLRSKGELSAAVEATQRLDAFNETQLRPLEMLARLQSAQNEPLKALATWKTLSARWPRHAPFVEAQGDVQWTVGSKDEALKSYDAALLLDGGNLSLRRRVERLRHGRELLEDDAVSTQAALKDYAESPGAEDAPASYVLDAAAIRVFPDGTMVDRVHIIQKALNAAGVSDVAEVTIPAGAQVLKLRTLKADGTVLDPENIDGKDTLSLPGVQVGDMVEYEYLQAHAPRSANLPGFTASSFFFQVLGFPNSWSSYVVRAPKAMGLKVDAHSMDAKPPVDEGEWTVFRHDERRVPPAIPEPQGPPTTTEVLPFVSVGAGATGNEGVVIEYADRVASRGQVTGDIERFAKTAAGKETGTKAVERVYVAVMDAVAGRDASLSGNASSTLAQGRGSRLWLLKAALSSLGFDARLVAVRALSADPAPYLFPTEHLLPYVCLRVTVPEGVLWLDTALRYSPFGEILELARGEREAYVLPEPGKPLERVRTPAGGNRIPKHVKLVAAVDEAGILTGQGEETYFGAEAAQLVDALDSVPADQQRAALQGALSRYFGGADLESVDLDLKREVGRPVKIAYTFKAARFGRIEGGQRLVLQPLTFPMQLGRRFLQLGRRRTPLFITGSEAVRSEVTLTLPEGFSVEQPVEEARTACPWGVFVRKETMKGRTFTVFEEYRLEAGRVPVNQYERFGQFAGEVDLLQQRDLIASHGTLALGDETFAPVLRKARALR